MKIKGRVSKRKLTKTTAKIARKVREHNRKARKESKAKRKSQPGMARKPKITIPRAAPFKVDLLKEIQRMKDSKALEQRQGKPKQQQQQRPSVKKDAAVEAKGSSGDPLVKTNNFSSQLDRVIEQADLLIEVLDARDPTGTRCKALEDRIIKSQKSLILLLNKVDLIPKENATEWLKHLRTEFPTLPFRANKVDRENFVTRLFSAVKAVDPKSSVVVGVVGFPNVGKSSVVNSLKGQKCCEAGSVAGMTRHLKEVRLSKQVRLIDCPGVILNAERYSQTDLALLNCVVLDKVRDPIHTVETMLQRCNGDQELIRFYRLPVSEESVLEKLAKKFGYLKKGGTPNIKAAASKILRDWTCGRILHHSKPPEDTLDHIVSSRLITIPEVADDEIPACSDGLLRPSIEIVCSSVPTDDCADDAEVAKGEDCEMSDVV